MQDLREEYLAGLAPQIEALESARDAWPDDPAARGRILALAHRLHGSGGTYGFPGISEAALRVEHSEPPRLSSSVDRLLEVLRRAVASAGDAERVLVVAHDDADLAAVRRGLESAGRRVLVARSAEEAWRCLQTEEVRAVLLDLVLPDADGRTVLRRISETPRTAALPVIVISAGIHPELQAECFRLGAEQVFSKPLDPQVLTAAAGSLLARAAEARRSSRQDPLTGLPNRAALLEAFTRMNGLMFRSGEPLSLALLDLDRFKSINDTHGHLTGDDVLCKFGRVLGEHLRRSDFVARYGGEEFAALFPATEPERAVTALENVRTALRDRRFSAPGSQEFTVTFSAGVAAVEPETTIENALATADRYLYLAKESGRNRILCPESTVEVPVKRILLAEDDDAVASIIQHCLGEQGFEVVRRRDGRAALEAARGASFSLGVLDINMPVMDGFELLQSLRAMPMFATTPIMMLTGRGDERDVVRSLDAGADDYVVKPFSPAELGARVRRLVKRS